MFFDVPNPRLSVIHSIIDAQNQIFRSDAIQCIPSVEYLVMPLFVELLSWYLL